jgi:hypothetical protein
VKRRPMSEPVVGIAAGYLPSRPMDKVTAAYQERQSAVSRRREKELQEEPAYVKAAERVAEIGGQNLDQERTERLGLRLHRGLGLSGGVIAGLLVARGINLGRRDPDGLRALAARRRGGQRALRVDPSSDGLSARDARSRSPWSLNLRRRPGCALGGGQRAALEKVYERGLRLAPLME